MLLASTWCSNERKYFDCDIIKSFEADEQPPSVDLIIKSARITIHYKVIAPAVSLLVEFFMNEFCVFCFF